MNEQMFGELKELLRIPSVSSGAVDPEQLRRAADWLIAKIEDAGGSAGIADLPGNPLVVGELEGPTGAPTVLIYGHYDVQSVDPLDGWDSDPFEPEIREGRLYGRGTSDDKGNFFPLLWVASDLAKRGELPVNVRIVIEGEEEVGGPNIARYIREDERGADCAVVFDSLMVNEDTPCLTLAVRGFVGAEIHVKTGARDLHSGIYGGSAMNAIHVLHSVLSGVMPGPDGRVAEELRKGAESPTDDELADWSRLPPGDQVLSEVGALPMWEGAGRDYYPQNWADASIDVTGVEGGTGAQRRTIVPSSAGCNVTLRLAPGQDPQAMEKTFVALLESGIPEGADVDITTYGLSGAARFDPESAPIRIARDALDRATGMTTRLTRIGGSLPILSALAERGIQTICTGFALAEDRIHAPNESFRMESLDLCESSARELLTALAEL